MRRSLSRDTRFEQGAAPADANALRVGAHVVIDVTGEPDELVATLVRVAPAAPAEPGASGSRASERDPGH